MVGDHHAKVVLPDFLYTLLQHRQDVFPDCIIRRVEFQAGNSLSKIDQTRSRIAFNHLVLLLEPAK
ncbi:hypothetical protein D3C85_1387570 [compost metagenome]